MWTLENYNEKESIILSVGVKDVVYEIAKNFDYENNLEFDENYSDGQFKKTADNSKLINLIKNFEFTKIEDGINKTIKWFNENYKNCRK